MRIFASYSYKGGFWFRIFGSGLSIVDRSIHPPLFSERIGLTKAIRIGKFSITFLTK